MKKLILAFVLTASVWSSFSHSANQNVTVNTYSGSSNTSSYFTISPNTFVAPEGASKCDYFWELGGVLTHQTFGEITEDLRDPANSCRFKLRSVEGSYSNTLSLPATDTTAEPTTTCHLQEGGFIDGYHNSIDDFCANIGTTGGLNPQPLMCIAKNLAETPVGSGQYQHFITPQECSAPTGPIAPDGTNPDPDPEPCTENCEPVDPETPPTGNDGSGIPSTGSGSNMGNVNVTGTQTDSQGNVTAINMTMEQDFSPLTERINETNQRLQVENQNSSTIIDQLNDLIAGNAANGQKLDTIANNIGGSGTDTTAMEGKLDGIKDSIDGIKDGFGTEQHGIDSANNVDLPDYGTAINDGFNQINEAMNTGAFKEHTDTLEGITGELTAFDSIPELFLYASQNCTPIPFGSHYLNTCQYAPTISAVLTWASYLLVVIFLFTSISATLTRIRLS